MFLRLITGSTIVAAVTASAVFGATPAAPRAAGEPQRTVKRIALDASIDDALVPVKRAKPKPKPPPPPPPEPVFELPERFGDGRVIEVSIEHQRLIAWEARRITKIYVISTGMSGWETPRGDFHVYSKSVEGYSRPWDVMMPWMLAFSGNYTIHQVTYPRGYPGLWQGRGTLGQPSSHGCVRMDLGDAEELYNWAAVGTPVWVH